MYDVDFDWYRSFLTIYRVGTVSGAAQARFLTQPAVTQHLAALEAVVGSPLFTRTPRRMIPTERGKELYNRVVQALEKLELVSQELGSESSSQPPLIRLGTPQEYFCERILPRLTALTFRFRVQFDVTQNLLEGLEHDNLDLIIATQRLPTSKVEYRLLGEEHYLLVGSSTITQPTFSEEGIPFLVQLETWLIAQKWVSYGVELPIIRRFWQQHFNHRPDVQPTLVIPNLQAIEQAVERGCGLSILPEYLCRTALAEGRLAVIWQPLEETVNQLWFAYRKIDRHHVDIKRVQEFLRDG